VGNASFPNSTVVGAIPTSGTEQIRVVDLDRGIERLATPEEIESGIFYRDFDHFKEGKAA
jgi:hypothetical protein